MYNIKVNFASISRIKALLSVNGFDEDLISGIDDDVWMSLAEAGYSNEVIPKPLVRIIRDDRHNMMGDTNRRVAGLDQYVNKGDIIMSQVNTIIDHIEPEFEKALIAFACLRIPPI